MCLTLYKYMSHFLKTNIKAYQICSKLFPTLNNYIMLDVDRAVIYLITKDKPFTIIE